MKATMPMLGWMALALALLVSFGIDLNNAMPGGAIDLRTRVTGARLLEHGLDPYHYTWHPGEPLDYCNPVENPGGAVNGTTVTPTLLLLHLPLSMLQYRRGHFVYLTAQWLLLLGLGWLWLRACATLRQRWLVALFLTGFTFTAGWRLHAERGQAYVLLAFVFAYWLTVTLDAKRGNGFWAGCVGGFLMALRPSFLVLAPFLVLHRRGQLAGAAVGLIAGAALPMLLNPAVWSEYFSAMSAHSNLYRNDVHPPQGPPVFPPSIEGMPLAHIKGYAEIRYSDYSGNALLSHLHVAHFPPPALLFIGLALFGLWLWLARRWAIEQLLPGLAAWIFLIDFFLPAARFSYYDVLILNAVFVAIVGAGRIPWAAWPCMAALPLGWAVYALSPGRHFYIDQPEIFFTVGAILFLSYPWDPGNAPIRESRISWVRRK
jgi:hypothetical protein